MNIPIYRAKKIDSVRLVDGYYFPQDYIGNYPNEDAEEREEIVKHFICGTTTHDIWDDEEGHFKFMGIDEIDPTTLAIHFPDMLDSQGNKIFASLSASGKGGDILRIEQLDEDEPFEDRTVLYNETSIHIKNMELEHYCHLDMINLQFANVIGIQK